MEDPPVQVWGDVWGVGYVKWGVGQWGGCMGLVGGVGEWGGCMGVRVGCGGVGCVLGVLVN